MRHAGGHILTGISFAPLPPGELDVQAIAARDVEGFVRHVLLLDDDRGLAAAKERSSTTCSQRTSKCAHREFHELMVILGGSSEPVSSPDEGSSIGCIAISESAVAAFACRSSRGAGAADAASASGRATLPETCRW